MQSTKVAAVQVSQQPSLMQALAQLVRPVAEQPRPLVAEPRGDDPRKATESAVQRGETGGERPLAKVDPAGLSRAAPRGTYLNIVV